MGVDGMRTYQYKQSIFFLNQHLNFIIFLFLRVGVWVKATKIDFCFLNVDKCSWLLN